MIKLTEIEKKSGVKNQFVLESNEPIRVEFIHTDSGQVIAFVYRDNGDITEYTEPIGMFDSDISNNGFED